MIRKETILIVEDEEALRALLEEQIRDMGYSTLVAENIEVAKKILKEGLVDLVVSDIQMPQGSGIDLVEWVRNYKYENNAFKAARIPFVIMTGYLEGFDAKKAREFGVVDFLPKPFDGFQLKTSIQEALKA